MFNKAIAKDETLLIARILMAALFVLFGWQKLNGFDATATSFAGMGLPLPTVAACIAVLFEFGFGLAIVFGLLTRPLALLLAMYTVIAGFIGHPYWSMSGAGVLDAEINFYKNVSITGGFFLLYLTGAGRYSLDALALREWRTNRSALGAYGKPHTNHSASRIP
jgi:putative oxidoreductase